MTGREEEKVKKIVLTGGPCAGKTTALAYLSQKLGELGYRVFLVPEVATMFITGGVSDISGLARNNFQKYLGVERAMILAMVAMRRHFNELAAVFAGEKRVIIYDRGPMDGLAYMPAEYFWALAEEHRFGLDELCDGYDAVVHMVTAAKGAEKFYTKENNAARQESPKEAGDADERTLNGWIGHPHLRIIDNSTGFDEKLRKVLKTVLSTLGIPEPLEIEKKFLLKKMPDLGKAGRVEKFFIEQMYLVSPEEGEIRIRKRSRGGLAAYYKTRKADVSAGKRRETEKLISPVDYFKLQDFKNPAAAVIRKHRHYFVYDNQYFELDLVLEPKNVCLLEIELAEENDRVILPPFIKVEKEVTGDPSYTNFGIAAGRL